MVNNTMINTLTRSRGLQIMRAMDNLTEEQTLKQAMRPVYKSIEDVIKTMKENALAQYALSLNTKMVCHGANKYVLMHRSAGIIGEISKSKITLPPKLEGTINRALIREIFND
jgi:hypothetical protein